MFFRYLHYGWITRVERGERQAQRRQHFVGRRCAGLPRCKGTVIAGKYECGPAGLDVLTNVLYLRLVACAFAEVRDHDIGVVQIHQRGPNELDGADLGDHVKERVKPLYVTDEPAPFLMRTWVTLHRVQDPDVDTTIMASSEIAQEVSEHSQVIVRRHVHDACRSPGDHRRLTLLDVSSRLITSDHDEHEDAERQTSPRTILPAPIEHTASLSN